jgi:hypothetical protein
VSGRGSAPIFGLGRGVGTVLLVAAWVAVGLLLGMIFPGDPPPQPAKRPSPHRADVVGPAR